MTLFNIPQSPFWICTKLNTSNQDMKPPWQPATARILPISPVIAPASSKQDHNEVFLSRDKHYALHGEIMMLVLVLVFSLFIVCLVIFPCIKRGGGGGGGSSESEYSGTIERRDYLGFSLKKGRRGNDGGGGDDDEQGKVSSSLQCKEEIEGKFTT